LEIGTATLGILAAATLGWRGRQASHSRGRRHRLCRCELPRGRRL